MRRCIVVLAALVFASGLSGCGRLLGQRYDNFTAYYNTFYNAKQAFEVEEEDLLNAERPVDRDRFLTLFVEPEGRPTEGFEKAVEKGADLLREHPESKWVDDALLLIGKAYFYQSNFTGAEQKFRETIALDEERLEDEAWFWLGRTLTAAERYEDAALALREGLDREGVREEWASQMRLALAEVDVREGAWDAAVASLQGGLEGLRDDELAARATFLLGQVYEVQGQPTEAANAYDRTLDYGPRYELAYAAQLSRALTLGLGGEGERALDDLRRMLRDDKNFENRAEIELTRARVLAAVGRPDAARDLLQRLLYDEDPSLRIGGLQGKIHFRLAEVYRDGLRNYIRAAAHYDSAATSIRQPDILDVQSTAQAITDAPAQAETFGNYARVATEIAEMDSLLYLGGLDEDAFAAAIDEIREQRAREAEQQARELERRRSEQGFRGGPGLDGFDGTTRASDDRGGQNDAGAGAGAGAGAAGGSDAGFLNFRNPVQVQEELVAFQARWGDRPLAPNWRRAAAIGGGVEVQEELAETLGETPGIQTPIQTREDFVDLSAVPRDPFTQQRMRANRAAARYELGNVLFLSLGQPDSAAVLYRSVIEEETESVIAQRAYFALAEAQRALGNRVEAERLYHEVIERFPDSRFADRARTELDLAPADRVAAADSVGLAEAGYAEAYAHWKGGDYAEALSQMLALSEEFPSTPAAARARLAAGALYTEWAAGNEAALLAVEPLVLTDSIPPTAPADTDSVDVVTEEAAAPPEQQASVEAGGEVSAALPRERTYAWVVASEPDSVAAVRVARTYLERGFDARVVPGEVQGSATYRVGIGRFPSREEALAARSVLPDEAPEDTWLLAVPGTAAPSEAPSTPQAPTAPVDPVTEDDAPRADPFAGADSTALPADTAGTTAAVDSLRDGLDLALADSARAVPDSVRALSDSAAVATAEPEKEPWLETLYASIEADFPGTPFAERARTLRNALDGLRDEPGPDDAEAAVDALRVSGVAGLFGADPIDTLKGTFTWSIFNTTSREEAELILVDTAGEGYRAAVYAEEGEEGTTYHVVVGEFASPDIAESIRPELAHIPDVEDVVLLNLEPGVELTQAVDLLRRQNQ